MSSEDDKLISLINPKFKRKERKSDMLKIHSERVKAKYSKNDKSDLIKEEVGNTEVSVPLPRDPSSILAFAGKEQAEKTQANKLPETNSVLLLEHEPIKLGKAADTSEIVDGEFTVLEDIPRDSDSQLPPPLPSSENSVIHLPDGNAEKYKQAVAEIDKQIAQKEKEKSEASWFNFWKKANLNNQIHSLQMSKTNLNREKRKDRNFEEAYAKYKPSGFAMADENQLKRFNPKGEKEYKRRKKELLEEEIETRKNELNKKIRKTQFESDYGTNETIEKNQPVLEQLYKSREHLELKTPLGRLNARLEKANNLPLLKRYTEGFVEKLKMATSSWEGAKLVGKEFSKSAIYTTGLVGLGMGVGYLTRSAAIASGLGVFAPVVAGFGGLAAGAAKQIYKDWGKELTKVEYAKRVAAAAAYGAVFATAGSLALPYLLEGASDVLHKFTGGSSIHGVGNPVTPEDIKNVTKGTPLYGPESTDSSIKNPVENVLYYKVLNPEKVINVDVPNDEVLKVVPGIEVTEPEPIKASLEKVNLNIEDVPSVAETIVENNPDVISGLITIEGNENLWNIISENLGGEQVAANAIHDHGKEFANYIMGKLNEQGIEISDKLQNSFEKILTDQNITGKERFWYRLPDGLELDINEIKEIMNKK
jgi:hypothetical protein